MHDAPTTARRAPPTGRGFARLGFILWVAACGLLPACGGGDAADAVGSLGLGTVALRNETDQGMAPLTVTEFYLVAQGEAGPGPNLLAQPALPGSVVIIGLYPAGAYDAVAVLSTGLNVNFVGEVVVAGQPTNFVIPGN